MILAVGNDGQFEKFCHAAGCPELITDARFQTNAGRVAHRAVLVPLLEEIIQAQTLDWWIETLEAAQVPCGPINTLDRVFADPHVQARGLKKDLNGIPSVGNPIRMRTMAEEADQAPPTLGNKTLDILRGMTNLSEAALKDLAAQGVIDT